MLPSNLDSKKELGQTRREPARINPQISTRKFKHASHGSVVNIAHPADYH
jgi:hypothetical protein